MNLAYNIILAIVMIGSIFSITIMWMFLPYEKYRKKDFNKEILFTIIMSLTVILCGLDATKEFYASKNTKKEVVVIKSNIQIIKNIESSTKINDFESDNNYLYNIVNDIQFESPIKESPTVINITKQLESDFQKSESVVLNKNSSAPKVNRFIPKKGNVPVTKIKEYKYLTISKEIPNLYRVSVISNQKLDYLIARNKLKNESDVYIGQKIYY